MSPGAWVTGEALAPTLGGRRPWSRALSLHCQLCVLSGGGQIHARVGGTWIGPSTAAWWVMLQPSPEEPAASGLGGWDEEVEFSSWVLSRWQLALALEPAWP